MRTQPLWEDPDTCRVECPHCGESFELEVGSAEWFKARRMLRYEALDDKIQEGNISAIRLGMEIGGEYIPKKLNVNLNATAQIDASVDAERAVLEAIRILSQQFKVSPAMYERTSKQLKLTHSAVSRLADGEVIDQ